MPPNGPSCWPPPAPDRDAQDSGVLLATGRPGGVCSGGLQPGSELYDRLGTLGKHFDKVGRSLTSAVGAYNDAVGSIEDGLPTARKLRDLKVTEKKLPAVSVSEAAVRPLTGAELVEDAAGVPRLSAGLDPTTSCRWPGLQPALTNSSLANSHDREEYSDRLEFSGSAATARQSPPPTHWASQRPPPPPTDQARPPPPPPTAPTRPVLRQGSRRISGS